MSEKIILDVTDSDVSMEQVNETLIPKIQSIEELNALMTSIKYGFYSHEKEENVTSPSNARMEKEYHLQAPETTVQKGIGLSWDTVLVSKFYLNKLGYQTKLFYVEDKQDPLRSPSHCLLFYKELDGNSKNVRWHWYEWSLDDFNGKDETADTWEELLKNTVAFAMSKASGKPVLVYSIGSYPKIGSAPAAFMEQIRAKSTFLGTCDAKLCSFTPPNNGVTKNGQQFNEAGSVRELMAKERARFAQEDYFEKGMNGSLVYVKETMDTVLASIHLPVVYELMKTYVDDVLSDLDCEHILRHYIANCLQHQWWVREFTKELSVRYHYSETGRHFLQQEDLRIHGQLVEHDSDKLHRVQTIAAYAVRVYNQHWEEGMNETHSLTINATGTKAIDEAWANHVKTQPHHPEHWDSSYVPQEKDLPDDQQRTPVHAETMPREYLFQMIGDWMAASLLRHKTANGWYDKTVGTRFMFTDRQRILMKDLLYMEKSIVEKLAALNPFATEAFESSLPFIFQTSSISLEDLSVEREKWLMECEKRSGVPAWILACFENIDQDSTMLDMFKQVRTISIKPNDTVQSPSTTVQQRTGSIWDRWILAISLLKDKGITVHPIVSILEGKTLLPKIEFDYKYSFGGKMYSYVVEFYDAAFHHRSFFEKVKSLFKDRDGIYREVSSGDAGAEVSYINCSTPKPGTKVADWEKACLEKKIGGKATVIGKSLESFGVDTDVVPADIHSVREIVGGPGTLTKITRINPVTGEKEDVPVDNYYINPVTGERTKADFEHARMKPSDMPGGETSMEGFKRASELMDVIWNRCQKYYSSKGSHGLSHIVDNLNKAQLMLTAAKESFSDEAFAAICFHDSALLASGRKDHELNSALIAHKELKDLFDNSTLDLICAAIREHRASFEGKFTSKLSDLVSSSDRMKPEIQQSVLRSFLYQKEHGASFDEACAAVVEHHKEKFGLHGYARYPDYYKLFFKKELDKFISDSEHLTVSKVQSIVGDPSTVEKRYTEMCTESFVSEKTSTASYEPPYTEQQLRDNGYSEDIIMKLKNDPVHKWRMESGIELIHIEPSKSELVRIWKNWNRMTVEQKVESDKKCNEFFGCTNEFLYNFLIPQYKVESPERKDIKYPSKEDLTTEAFKATGNHLYTYLPKESSVRTKGVLSTKLVPDAWKKYKKRCADYFDYPEDKEVTEADVMKYLDSTVKDRSKGFCCFTSPIPDNAPADFLDYRDSHQLVILPSYEELKTLGIVEACWAENLKWEPDNNQPEWIKVSGPKYSETLVYPEPKNSKLLFVATEHYLIITKNGSVPAKYCSFETDLATEALQGFKTKKQKIIDYVCGCLDLIDPTKDNSKRFSDLVSPMDEKQFAKYIQNLRDGNCSIDIVAPNMKKHLQMEDVFAAAKKIGCKLFERIWLYDMTTGKEYLSTEEFPIFCLSVRRQEQMMDEKLSVPNSAMKIDALTGQVTGDDRAGGFSQPEIQIMYSKGFMKTLEEFVKVRGGDVHAFADFERQLEETGSASLNQIKVKSRARSGAVLAAYMEAAHLDTNI